MTRPGDFEPAPRRRRRRIIDDRGLLEAVLDVGFERLTIAAVAQRLGTAHSAIYHHVADRDALVGMAMDHLVGEAEWPELDGGWRDVLHDSALVLWSMLDAHPGLALELTLLAMPSSRYRAHLQGLTGYLETLGLEPTEAFLCVDLVMDLAVDAAIRSRFQELRYPAPRADAGVDWFRKKLEIALDGIEARLK